jgi:hypothetical protein
VVFILFKKCLGCSFQWLKRNTFQRSLLCTSPSSSHSTTYAYNYAGFLYTMLRNKKDAFNTFAAHLTTSHQRTWKNAKCSLVTEKEKEPIKQTAQNGLHFPPTAPFAHCRGYAGPVEVHTNILAILRVTSCTCKVIQIEFTAALRDCQNRWSNNCYIYLLNDLLSIRAINA